MKKLYLLVSFFCATLAISAQSKLDLLSRARLRNQKLELKQSETGKYNANVRKIKSVMGVPSSHTLGIIKLAEGATEEDLKAEGVNVLRCRYGFAFVSMPVGDVERIASLKGVRRLQLARPVKQNMKYARAATGVDKIHQGLGLPQAYTGKGVVCGIVDGGLDANHINFRNENGSSRIGFLAHLKANQYATSIDDAVIEKFYNRDEISDFTTDDNTTYHGTHTLGIMAGGYRGLSTVANAGDNGRATLDEEANPYYGVAYEADIAAACGDLMDLIIAYGVDYILQYAEYEKKPCVINLSLGSNSGAHDGKGVINQFFDLMAKECNAIICVSAGNEGDMKIALNKTFTSTDTELKTFIAGLDTDFGGETGTAYARYGNTLIYSDNDKPFEMQAVVFNKKRGAVAKRFSLTPTEENKGSGKYIVSSSDYAQEANDIIDNTFGRYFNGYIGIGWDIDQDNNRFYAIIDYMAINNTLTNADGNYEIGFIVKGSEGQRIYSYCDGQYSSLSNAGVEGWDDGMRNGSISDLASGNNILVVGSYNTSEGWGGLDSYVYKAAADIPTGEITYFSSYGTLIDGRNLPHICAPGASIISSSSSYFVNAGYTDNSALSAKVDEDGRTNYWGWAMGTSMASPHVAGAIALWLEADPTLTLNDIKDIVATTAIKDEAVRKADPVQAGAGKFDAYGGLKEVLRRAASGLGSITADRNRLVVSPAGERAFNVFLGGATELRTAVYDITGKAVMRKTTRGDEASVDMSSLAKGVYVINVNGCYSQRVVVR